METRAPWICFPGLRCTCLQAHAPMVNATERHSIKNRSMETSLCMISLLTPISEAGSMILEGHPDSHVSPLQCQSALETEKRVALPKLPNLTSLHVELGMEGEIRTMWTGSPDLCILNVSVSLYQAGRKYSTFWSKLLFTAMFHYKIKIFTEREKRHKNKQSTMR